MRRLRAPIEVSLPRGCFREVPMPQSKLLMRQIRELRHLHFERGLSSQRLIARSLGAWRQIDSPWLHD